ncbi:MAG: radical SAM family heme chaperone HemW [Alphaproteobacteria bacterium]|nr:radical SAM family heme chaperone HemW [Rhodospirillales bacterium]MCW9046227.1 radical SAM family heme chaperone HemW [Alphaproteobacteria bacterium]
MNAETSPLGLYIHWPFCVSKCPYCDFNSHTVEALDEGVWLLAYLSELERYHRQTQGREISTIFFGGGTPSLMAPKTVNAILAKAAELWPMAPDLEITLEANPTTAEAGRFKDFEKAGVNRLSIGVQSFDENALRFLGRAHGVNEAEKTIELAANTFPRFSFDLIYGLPDQSLENWQAELGHALSFKPEHLSVYQLTIEQGTVFFKQGIEAIESDLGADFYELTNEILNGAGLPAYEISNHAKPGSECRHNLIYWRGQDYIGIGPGAHGRLTTPQGVLATQEIPKPTSWLKGVQQSKFLAPYTEVLTPKDRQIELILMGLRLKEGITLKRYEYQSGEKLLSVISRKSLNEFIELDLLVLDNVSLKATAEGMLVLNHLIKRLLED